LSNNAAERALHGIALGRKSWLFAGSDRGGEGAAEDGEGEIDVGAPLLAHGQAAEAAEPRQGAFHHPAVPSQALAALDATPGDAGRDAALAARPADAPVV
jgi:hypothetical protein